MKSFTNDMLMIPYQSTCKMQEYRSHSKSFIRRVLSNVQRVSSCPTCLMCLRTLCAHVPTCICFLRAFIFLCDLCAFIFLRAFCAFIFLRALCALNFLHALRAFLFLRTLRAFLSTSFTCLQFFKCSQFLMCLM